HGNLTIRLLLFLPDSVSKPVPLFLLLNHRELSNTDPDRNTIEDFWPAEEVIARGYGIATIGTDDLSLDTEGTFRDPAINLFNNEVTLPDNAWRTIAAWAWGGSRAMDYFETDADIDNTRIAVVGHSRGGKASLWCGAEDERFALTISNDSGCNGAALSRRRVGRTLAAADVLFPYWFNENYKQYNDNEDNLPFDQHELIALMAPRLVYIASAQTDSNADPEGEFLSGVHAGPVYELFGLQGLGTAIWPALDTPIQTGSIGYHIRTGDHDMTSYDWQRFMDFADLNIDKLPTPIVNTGASGVTSNSADLVGLLSFPDGEVTVDVYWSTNNNADEAAWLADVADGDAQSMEIGTYNNVTDQSVTGSVSSLIPNVTYYYTMAATNGATNIWASPNVSFTPFAPTPPAVEYCTLKTWPHQAGTP
ncbi:MAG: hypothetical protein OSB41_11625, partial [Kiritimatiellae bacterium]|nr:hypothetical protein [Kiritimatiellia bacterium]